MFIFLYGSIFWCRCWTAFSTGILIIPCVWLGFAVGYLTLIAYSSSFLLCGFAGANFASSSRQTSASSFRNRAGRRAGSNGGLGNMGVSVMQLVARWWYHCRFSQYLVARASNSRMGLSCIWRMRPADGCCSSDHDRAWFGMNDICYSEKPPSRSSCQYSNGVICGL